MRHLWPVASLLLSLTLVSAQEQGIYIGPTDVPAPVWATSSDFNGRMPFCRGYYISNRYELNGVGWFTDYPGADINFLVRLGELTAIRPGSPVVVKLDSPLLMQCPMLYMSDVGTLLLSNAEIRNLRIYLDKGGFLWVDDFWGYEAWDQWMSEIRKVLPRNHIVTIRATHPLFRQLYNIDGIWQQPTTGLWVLADWDGNRITSERDDDSREPTIAGIPDAKGRLVVLMTHNTDIADGWEAAEQAENREYFEAFSARSYGLGTNIVLYLLTH